MPKPRVSQDFWNFQIPTPQDLSATNPSRPEPLRKQSSIDDPRNSDLSPRSVDTLVHWEMAFSIKHPRHHCLGQIQHVFRITRPINQNLHIKSISEVLLLTSNSSIHRTLWTTLIFQKHANTVVTTPGFESFVVISCIWAHKQLVEDAIEEWQSSAEDNEGDDLRVKGQSFPPNIW